MCKTMDDKNMNSFEKEVVEELGNNTKQYSAINYHDLENFLMAWKLFLRLSER